MTLNFPTDISAPYVDPVSGLKYVYNTTVGAWESAIQPPSIIAADEPDILIEGFLWFNTTDGNLYVYHNGAWQTVGTDGGGSTVRMSAAPPAPAANGDLWWDTESGRLYVYYSDVDSSQWIDAAPNQSVGGSGVATGLSAPSDPQEGDLWLNLGNNSLNVYHNNAWVQTQPAVSGLQSLTVNTPITDTGTALDPVLSVSPATSSTTGAVRLATQSEVNDASLTSVALTPGTLANGISNYLADADQTTKGVAEIATSAEIVTGTDDTKVISPLGLATALPQIGLAVPPGTVITFAGATAPSSFPRARKLAPSRHAARVTERSSHVVGAAFVRSGHATSKILFTRDQNCLHPRACGASEMGLLSLPADASNPEPMCFALPAGAPETQN